MNYNYKKAYFSFMNNFPQELYNKDMFSIVFRLIAALGTNLYVYEL